MVVPPPHVSKAIFAGKNAFDEQYDGAADAAALRYDVLFRADGFAKRHPVFLCRRSASLNQRIGPAPFRHRALTNVQWSRTRHDPTVPNNKDKSGESENGRLSHRPK